MPAMRYFLVLVVLVVVVQVLQRVVRGLRQGTGPTRQRTIAQPTVACASCGVHVPQQEAVFEAGQAYCCRAHGALGPAQDMKNS
ncbi:MAG: PP0621 family protein [Brachymonas sp.]|nr:PP0621 family protein [Brachymonas sp.]